MAKLIGTAGHVDHGKTTLIKALTGIDADRLPEEKRRGMTIDIGFAFLDLPQSGRVSIVDVPGHERFLGNMLVGSYGVDVALVCVSADAGVMPQTREHMEILELLPVQTAVIALTQCDVVDRETLEIARLDVSDWLAKSRFAAAAIVETSAETGQGLDELRDELDKALQAAIPREKGSWKLPIDRVFSSKGHGTVVTGTLGGAAIHVGDEVEIQPGDLKARVRSIQSHGETLSTVEPGRRVALNLSGVKQEDLARGQIAGEPETVFATSVIDVQMQWLGEVKHAVRIRAAIGAEEAIGKVFLSEGDSSIAQLRLESEVGCGKGQPVIIRNYSPPTLLGGGRVLVPVATKRRRSEAVSAPIEAALDGQIIEILRGQAQGVTTDEVCRRLGQSPQSLGDVFEALIDEERVVGFAGLWFDVASWTSSSEKFLETLRQLHRENPRKGAHPRETVGSKAGFRWSGRPFDRMLQRLSDEAKIVAHGTLIRLADFQIELNPKQEALLARVREVLEKHGINVPFPVQLAQECSVPPQAVEEILRLGMEAGELIRIADGVVYAKTWLESMRQDLATRYSGRAFTAAEFRDDFQTSRKYAIPLLEYFDSLGFTVRSGESRIVRESD